MILAVYDKGGLSSTRRAKRHINWLGNEDVYHILEPRAAAVKPLGAHSLDGALSECLVKGCKCRSEAF